jgi:hypothetical protein
MLSSSSGVIVILGRYRHPRALSSSSGSTRGSAGAAIIFTVESNDVTARDALVEPEHDVTR